MPRYSSVSSLFAQFIHHAGSATNITTGSGASATSDRAPTGVHGSIRGVAASPASTRVKVHPAVVNLREIHSAIDHAVLGAYGWDLDPEIGHHPTKIGTRCWCGCRAWP